MNAIFQKRPVKAELIGNERYFISDESGFLGLLSIGTGQLFMSQKRGGFVLPIHKYSFKLLDK